MCVYGESIHVRGVCVICMDECTGECWVHMHMYGECIYMGECGVYWGGWQVFL